VARSHLEEHEGAMGMEKAGVLELRVDQSNQSNPFYRLGVHQHAGGKYDDSVISFQVGFSFCLFLVILISNFLFNRMPFDWTQMTMPVGKDWLSPIQGKANTWPL